jgi:class 3 adenylate cyclase
MNLEEINQQLKLVETKIKLGDYKTSEELTQSALDAINLFTFDFENQDIEILRVKSYLNYSYIAQRQGNFSKANQLAEDTLPIIEKYGFKDQLARYYRLLGLIHSGQASFEKALEFYANAELVLEELGDINELAAIKGNMANVYFNLNDYNKALENYSKVITTYEQLGNKIGIASIKGNSASAYLMLGEHQKSLDLQLEVIELHRELGKRSSEGNALLNIGNAYLNLENSEKALESYFASKSIFEKLGEKTKIVDSIYSLGSLYSTNILDTYNPELAEQYLLEALKCCEDIGVKDLEYRTQYRLMTLYRQEKRFEESLNYFEKFHRTEKIVLSASAKKKAEQLELEKIVADREKATEIEKAEDQARLFATKSLLHKILPEVISDRMIVGEEIISDFFPSASILFADMVGFTSMTAQMNALDVGRFLNYVFGEFDLIMKKHGCEKIKTIGDGYMAAAGVPIECSDHALRLANAALEMFSVQSLPNHIKKLIPINSKFEFRIGINSGPVMAGVMGKDRFIYDIFSDAVNLASRMESHGESGKIHVSEAVKNELINSSFHFESRGIIEVKGKGSMHTYFLKIK